MRSSKLHHRHQKLHAALLALLLVGILAMTQGLDWDQAKATPPQSTPGEYFPTRERALDNVEIPAGATSTVRVAGIGAVPRSGVSTVALNVAAKGTTGTGTIAVFPADDTDQATAAVSYRQNAYAGNLVTAKVGSDGNVKVVNKGPGAVRVYLDVHGYTLGHAGGVPGSTYVPLAPARIADAVVVPANGNYELAPLGRGGIPATGVESLAYTLQAEADSSGTLRAYAAGEGGPPMPRSTTFPAGHSRTLPSPNSV